MDKAEVRKSSQSINKFTKFISAYEELVVAKRRAQKNENLEGAEICTSCGVKAVVVESRQLRSGDEEAQGVKVCQYCNSKQS
jgi:DNA-directed RNA polymerase subunit M/transcription elongation factor TFIIS